MSPHALVLLKFGLALAASLALAGHFLAARDVRDWLRRRARRWRAR